MLHIHSCYEFGASLITVEGLAHSALEKGISYIALCDRRMHGIAKLFAEAERNQLLPIAGIEIDQKDKTRINIFARNIRGYLQLVAYQNERIRQDSLLDSEDTLKVFQCSVNDFSIKASNHPHSFFAVYPDTLETAPMQSIPKGLLLFFPPVVLLREEDKPLLDILTKVQPTAQDSENGIAYDNPTLWAGTAPIVDCGLETLQKILPLFEPYTLKRAIQFPLPPDWKSRMDQMDEEAMVRSCFSERSIFEKDSRYRNRLDKEMDILSKKGFFRYLLLVRDIVTVARQNDCWVGPGRGSAVSSLVVHLLGITYPDPVKEGLLFERFLSQDRFDEPDIDIDLEDTQRNHLFQLLADRYGKEHLCRITTYGTFGDKGLKRLLEWKSDQFTQEERTFIRRNGMKMIEKLPRNTSTHAAGVLVSEEDLLSILPMMPQKDLMVSQYDMGDLAELGYTKLDLLGLSTLSFLKQVGTPIESIPIDDPNLYSQIHPRNLCGIFQLDSSFGRSITDRFQPINLPETRALISLNRPGPIQSGMTERMLQMKAEDSDQKLPHPDLQEILGETFGLSIYQEQLMEILMRFGGFSGEEANQFRKKRISIDTEEGKKLYQRWVQNAEDNGLGREFAARWFSDMEHLSLYAFPKAHASAYVYLTLACVWAKKRDPALFYSHWIHQCASHPHDCFWVTQEALWNGLSVLPMDILSSDVYSRSEGNGVRLGLSLIPNLPMAWIRECIQLRTEPVPGEKLDFDGICRNTSTILSDSVLRSLTLSGALDALFGYHPTYSEVLSKYRRRQQEVKDLGNAIFGKAKQPSSFPPILEKTRFGNLVLDQMELFGFSPSLFPCSGLRFQPFTRDDSFRFFVRQISPEQSEPVFVSGIDQLRKNDFRIDPGERTVIFCGRKSGWIPLGTLDPLTKELSIGSSLTSAEWERISKAKEALQSAGVQRISVLVGTTRISIEWKPEQRR